MTSLKNTITAATLYSPIVCEKRIRARQLPTFGSHFVCYCPVRRYFSIKNFNVTRSQPRVCPKLGKGRNVSLDMLKIPLRSPVAPTYQDLSVRSAGQMHLFCGKAPLTPATIRILPAPALDWRAPGGA
ncbi:hypothetical protein SAMN05444169_7539 [Bradyrhizobium erythrophlei]|uniref:Uncharacterized protein n=1 Tax=Bradyrhizobium erythrophlei TaxID=1437360 RepID=A0A1M5T3N9_9BRAD|nr:hypothetical protein SAMN05444169_7539 [Bradyrhizobium erythrophlei]